MNRKRWIWLLAFTACGAPDTTRDDSPPAGDGTTSVAAADTGWEDLGNLGTVRLQAECGEVANRHAETGLALLHHMTYLDAREAFTAAVEADPGCGFGYSGQAMTIIHPLWPDAPTDDQLEEGWGLVEQARERASGDDRATAYLSTVEAYFRDGVDRTEGERLGSFDEAWTRVHEAFPDDLEARTLSALARLSTLSLADKTYQRQYEALDLLDEVLEAMPHHPGAQHYTIHARDYPPLAEEALDLARAYARLAPDVPHALHMPTHIYTRVGNWDESIDGNDRAAESSWKHGQTLGGILTDFHHSLDYLAYAHLQRGEDQKALEVVERAIAADGPWAAVNLVVIAYALSAIPARYALERGDWDAAAALVPRSPSGFPWGDGFAPFVALTQFAKALGGARGGQPEIAREAIADLEALSEQISQTSADAYWKTQVQVQLLASRGWLAFETEDRSSGLELMSEAARIEDSTGKGPVTPGELLPAAELLGEMLLEMGQAGEALAAFQAALARSPGRLNGLAGAARAARASGRDDLAADYYRELIALTSEAEVERVAMTEARAFLAEVGP